MRKIDRFKNIIFIKRNEKIKKQKMKKIKGEIFLIYLFTL